MYSLQKNMAHSGRNDGCMNGSCVSDREIISTTWHIKLVCTGWWVKEYGILNGTALTDAITTDCFLRDFQLTYATLFSGVRHDSGNPFEWGEKMIRHYESLGIDPKTKTLLFSDSLDFERADKIASYFAGKVKIALESELIFQMTRMFRR